MQNFASKLGIVVNFLASNGPGRASGNPGGDLASGAANILTKILGWLAGVVNVIWTILMQGIWHLVRFVFNIMDVLQFFIRRLVGIDIYDNPNWANITELKDSDLIIRLITSKVMMKLFRTVLIFSALLLVVFCIIAIVRSNYKLALGEEDKDKGNAFSVLKRAVKSMFLCFVTPFILIIGILGSNVILSSLCKLVQGNNNLTLGGVIFTTSAYDANKYRVYAKGGERIPMIYSTATELVNPCDYTETDDMRALFYDVAMGNVYIKSMSDDIEEARLGVDTQVGDSTYNYNLDAWYDTFKTINVEMKSSTSTYGGAAALGLRFVFDTVIGTIDSMWDSDNELSNVSDEFVAFEDDFQKWYEVYCKSTPLDNLFLTNKTIREIYNTNWTANDSLNKTKIDFSRTYVEQPDKVLFDGKAVSIIKNSTAYSIYEPFATMPIEYYVMADLIDYSIEKGVDFYFVNANNSSIKWSDIDVYSVGNSNTEAKESVNIDTYSDNYSVWEYTDTDNTQSYLVNCGQVEAENYKAKKVSSTAFYVEYYDGMRRLYWSADNSSSEADGATFIICFKENEYFIPVTQETSNFHSNFLAESYDGPIVARGIFTNSILLKDPVSPSLIKEQMVDDEGYEKNMSNFNGQTSICNVLNKNKSEKTTIFNSPANISSFVGFTSNATGGFADTTSGGFQRTATNSYSLIRAVKQTIKTDWLLDAAVEVGEVGYNISGWLANGLNKLMIANTGWVSFEENTIVDSTLPVLDSYGLVSNHLFCNFNYQDNAGYHTINDLYINNNIHYYAMMEQEGKNYVTFYDSAKHKMRISNKFTSEGAQIVDYSQKYEIELKNGFPKEVFLYYIVGKDSAYNIVVSENELNSDDIESLAVLNGKIVDLSDLMIIKYKGELLSFNYSSGLTSIAEQVVNMLVGVEAEGIYQKGYNGDQFVKSGYFDALKYNRTLTSSDKFNQNVYVKSNERVVTATLGEGDNADFLLDIVDTDKYGQSESSLKVFKRELVGLYIDNGVVKRIDGTEFVDSRIAYSTDKKQLVAKNVSLSTRDGLASLYYNLLGNIDLSLKDIANTLYKIVKNGIAAGGYDDIDLGHDVLNNLAECVLENDYENLDFRVSALAIGTVSVNNGDDALSSKVYNLIKTICFSEDEDTHILTLLKLEEIYNNIVGLGESDLELLGNYIINLLYGNEFMIGVGSTVKKLDASTYLTKTTSIVDEATKEESVKTKLTYYNDLGVQVGQSRETNGNITKVSKVLSYYLYVDTVNSKTTINFGTFCDSTGTNGITSGDMPFGEGIDFSMFDVGQAKEDVNKYILNVKVDYILFTGDTSTGETKNDVIGLSIAMASLIPPQETTPAILLKNGSIIDGYSSALIMNSSLLKTIVAQSLPMLSGNGDYNFVNALSVTQKNTYDNIYIYFVQGEFANTFFFDTALHANLNLVEDFINNTSPIVFRLKAQMGPNYSNAVIYRLQSGRFALNYNFNENTGIGIKYLYDLGKLNPLVLIFATGVVSTMLINMVWNLIARIYEVGIKFVILPAVLASDVLNDGKFNTWRSGVIGKVMMAYSTLIMLNLYFALIPSINELSADLIHWSDLPETFTSMFANVGKGLFAGFKGSNLTGSIGVGGLSNTVSMLLELSTDAVNSISGWLNKIIYLMFFLVLTTLVKKGHSVLGDFTGSTTDLTSGDVVKDVTGLKDSYDKSLVGKGLHLSENLAKKAYEASKDGFKNLHGNAKFRSVTADDLLGLSGAGGSGGGSTDGSNLATAPTSLGPSTVNLNVSPLAVNSTFTAPASNQSGSSGIAMDSGVPTGGSDSEDKPNESHSSSSSAGGYDDGGVPTTGGNHGSGGGGYMFSSGGGHRGSDEVDGYQPYIDKRMSAEQLMDKAKDIKETYETADKEYKRYSKMAKNEYTTEDAEKYKTLQKENEALADDFATAVEDRAKATAGSTEAMALDRKITQISQSVSKNNEELSALEEKKNKQKEFKQMASDAKVERDISKKDLDAHIAEIGKKRSTEDPNLMQKQEEAEETVEIAKGEVKRAVASQAENMELGKAAVHEITELRKEIKALEKELKEQQKIRGENYDIVSGKDGKTHTDEEKEMARSARGKANAEVKRLKSEIEAKTEEMHKLESDGKDIITTGRKKINEREKELAQAEKEKKTIDDEVKRVARLDAKQKELDDKGSGGGSGSGSGGGVTDGQLSRMEKGITERFSRVDKGINEVNNDLQNTKRTVNQAADAKKTGEAINTLKTNTEKEFDKTKASIDQTRRDNAEVNAMRLNQEGYRVVKKGKKAGKIVGPKKK